MTKVYKVTAIDSRSPYTIYEHQLQYSMDIKIYPAIGKIFAYKTLEDAKNWMKDKWTRLIWEAEADIFQTENVVEAGYWKWFNRRFHNSLAVNSYPCS